MKGISSNHGFKIKIFLRLARYIVQIVRLALVTRFPIPGVVVRESASHAVDLEFTMLVESYQKTLKMLFTVSLHERGGVEKKSLNSFVVCLGKALH